MLVRVAEVERTRRTEELVEGHGHADREDVREALVGALVHGREQGAVAVDRLAALRAVDGADVALRRADEARHRRDCRVPDIEAERAVLVTDAESAGDLRQRIEIEPRVLEAGRGRIEEATRAHREDAVESIEVVRAADAHAERVGVAVHDERIDVLEGSEHRDLQTRSVALRRAPSFVRRVELEIIDLEVAVHLDVATARADDERELRREERLSRRERHGERLGRRWSEDPGSHDRHRRAHRQTEREARARSDERAERPRERGGGRDERVARVARLILAGGHALPEVRI